MQMTSEDSKLEIVGAAEAVPKDTETSQPTADDSAVDSEILRPLAKRRKAAGGGASKKRTRLILDNGDDDVAAAVIIPSAEPTESSSAPSKPRSRLGMDPSVDTSGVPDRDKSNLEKSLRQQLESEWHSKQAAIKQQPISIVYSYWDGAGHRRKLACKKGDTIAHFLSLVKLQFPRELAKCRTVDELVFVKEDLILPHNITFYDLIVNKARGKSGPLFDFSAKDDVRIEMDGRKEKEDTHAAKVCERRWYERHKHTFPASRWEQFDPQRDYGSYSTK